MFLLDGEIGIPAESGFSFDALPQRIHPAASRVRRPATETPANYAVFDLLATEDGRSLLVQPLRERLSRLGGGGLLKTRLEWRVGNYKATSCRLFDKENCGKGEVPEGNISRSCYQMGGCIVKRG